MKKTDNLWIAEFPEKLPDFIIGGAMKSGTTTLHSILNAHPDISIAHGELGFFDMDNLLDHADFSFFNEQNQQWIYQSMEKNPQEMWKWYYSKFPTKKEGVLIGEDSTTYLASTIAPKRIALQEKPIKMIFILRHPTKRTISNYLHSLKTGRAIYNLEDTLRFDSYSILKRSMYVEQLENYYRIMPFEQIKVVLFEELISDTTSVIKEICDFLELDFAKFNITDLSKHSNKTKIPKNEKLQLKRNRMIRKIGDFRYANNLPISSKRKTPTKFQQIINKVHKKINPHQELKYTPIPSTINYLDDFFKSYMEGINEIVKKDITSVWFE